jgi:pimeloyl-ACP methyl ester carboxylesterase
LLTLLFILSVPAYSSDLAKEKRWAEQIADAIFDGEIIMLKDDDIDFLSIYTPASDSRNAVILLHGVGVHPDWDQVIRPLRVGLPENGWSTLSIQLPVLPNGAPYEKYLPLFKEVPGRLDAGIALLKQKGAERIIVVAHSMGSSMGAYYLAKNQPELVKGFVAIGMGGAEKYRQDNVGYLKSIEVPILDLYGELDLEGVIASVGARRDAIMTKGDASSAQRVVAGADHFFDGKNGALLSEVLGWLEKF